MTNKAIIQNDNSRDPKFSHMEIRPNRLLCLIGILLTPIPSALMTCLIFGIILKTYEGIIGKEISFSVVMPLLIITFAVIQVSFILYILKIQNRYFVVIDDKNIYFGKKKETKLPFNEITALIIGLPEKMTSALNTNKHLNRGLWSSLVIERERALLIINRDGSIMQFNIHKFKNGTKLMTAFVDINRDKLITDYQYNDEQTEILRQPRWNTLCRSIEIEQAFGYIKSQV